MRFSILGALFGTVALAGAGGVAITQTSASDPLRSRDTPINAQVVALATTPAPAETPPPDEYVLTTEVVKKRGVSYLDVSIEYDGAAIFGVEQRVCKRRSCKTATADIPVTAGTGKSTTRLGRGAYKKRGEAAVAVTPLPTVTVTEPGPTVTVTEPAPTVTVTFTCQPVPAETPPTGPPPDPPTATQSGTPTASVTPTGTPPPPPPADTPPPTDAPPPTATVTATPTNQPPDDPSAPPTDTAPPTTPPTEIPVCPAPEQPTGEPTQDPTDTAPPPETPTGAPTQTPTPTPTTPADPPAQ